MAGYFVWLVQVNVFAVKKDIKKPACAGFFIGIRPVL